MPLRFLADHCISISISIVQTESCPIRCVSHATVCCPRHAPLTSWILIISKFRAFYLWPFVCPAMRRDIYC